MKNLFLTILGLLICELSLAQDEWQRQWGIEASIAGGSFTNNKTLTNEDQYDSFSITADYYLTPRLAVSGGLYLEQDGIMTDYANGIGTRKINMMGPEVGGKFYFFPQKWIVQPYLATTIKTNILNLSTQKGGFTYDGNSFYGKTNVSYDVKCPVASICPKLGVDIRLTKNIILTANMDYRFGLYGHNRSHIDFLEADRTSRDIDESMVRNGFALGVKVDLPWNSNTNNKISKGLLYLFQSIVSSHKY